jgi:hypothetical protein
MSPEKTGKLKGIYEQPPGSGVWWIHRIRLSNAPCCSAGFNGALDS